MAILAVHYPFQYKSCCLIKLRVCHGTKRGLLAFQFAGESARCCHGLFVGLTAQLDKFSICLCQSSFNCRLTGSLGIGQHLPCSGFCLSYGSLCVGLCLSDVCKCFK